MKAATIALDPKDGQPVEHSAQLKESRERRPIGSDSQSARRPRPLEQGEGNQGRRIDYGRDLVCQG